MTRAARTWCTALLAGALALCANSASAAAPDPALDAVIAHLRARGATQVAEVARGFLFEGQSTAHEQRLAKSSCVAYLALGLGEVRDVDLGLYTRAGQLVAEDVAAAPYAYARVCGAAGLGLYASASLYAGRGQLVLLRVEDAPRELGRLPESLPLAVSAGGRLEELRAVGAAADELSPEAAVVQDERAHTALGYTPATAAITLPLRAGTARGVLSLRHGVCYRIAAVVPLARGVAIEVDGPERWSMRSPGEDRSSVALCPPRHGGYPVRVHARLLRGFALVRAFEHRGTDPVRAGELGAATALGLAEAEHVARARGLDLAPLGNAWVEANAPLAWPLSVPDLRCYAIAVVSESGATGVDVRLTDAHGVLIAHNEGRRGVPMVFACPREPGPVHLLLRARGPDLPVSLWIGRGPERAP